MVDRGVVNTSLLLKLWSTSPAHPRERTVVNLLQLSSNWSLNHLQPLSLLPDHQYSVLEAMSPGDIFSYLTCIYSSLNWKFGESQVFSLNDSTFESFRLDLRSVWYLNLILKAYPYALDSQFLFSLQSVHCCNNWWIDLSLLILQSQSW